MQGGYFSKRIYTPRPLLRDFQNILAHFHEFRLAVRSQRISKAFGEKIMLAVTAVNGCRYCSYGHARAALASGVSQEEVNLLLGGEIGHVSPDEAPALFFAQHYAESGDYPDPEMVQKLVETYGQEKARDILAHIRMITFGNLSGNTFDALLSRLRGRPAEGSSLGSELATLALLVLGTPLLALGIVAKRITHRGEEREYRVTEENAIKILVYGAGVLGSVYAAELKEGGHDVSILARGQRLADIHEHGIVLEELETGFRTTTHVNVVERLEPDDAYDLVLVLMRANQVQAVLPALAASRRTPNVLFVGNNAAGPGKMVEALGRERVLMGFGGTGGVREGHVIRYLARSDYGNAPLLIGELDGQITPRLQRIAEGFGGAGTQVGFSPNIEAYLRTHVALISPIANAIYMAGGDNYRLARTRDGVVLMVRAVREGFRVLRALGVPITPSKLKVFDWIPEPVLVALMRRVFNTEMAEIGMTGHANAARDEMKHLADEFKALARATSVPTPALDRLYAYIDPAVPPVSEGNAQIPMDWRGVWVGLGVLAGLVLVWKLLRDKRR